MFQMWSSPPLYTTKSGEMGTTKMGFALYLWYMRKKINEKNFRIYSTSKNMKKSSYKHVSGNASFSWYRVLKLKNKHIFYNMLNGFYPILLKFGNIIYSDKDLISLFQNKHFKFSAVSAGILINKIVKKKKCMSQTLL